MPTTLMGYATTQQPKLIETEVIASFADYLSKFKEFGTHTTVTLIDGISYYTNEFWTSGQRQAERIQEISYRACFKPQLPAFFIKNLTSKNDIVLDPFMGRGTTPIEAAILGRTPYGNDINPLSLALVEPRINPPHYIAIKARLESIPWKNFTSYENKDLLAFYHPNTLAEIEGLRLWLITKNQGKGLDVIDKWIRMVAINRLTGHSNGFLSVYTLPPNQAVSIKSQNSINQKRNQVPPYRNVPETILKKTRSLLSGKHPMAANSLFTVGNSYNLPEITDSSVALTVTSPPFLDIVNYNADNWLRCWFLGIDSATVPVSKHKKISDWEVFTKQTLIELVRVTKKGGYIAYEVGEVRKKSIQLENNVITAANGLPLELIGVVINQQNFTKTSNMWGIANNQSGTNTNRIVIFRKQ